MRARVTISDVASKAQVSTATVSRVLSIDPQSAFPIATETRQRVLRAARDLNYVSHAYARGLRRRTSPMVGFLIPELVGPYLPLLVNHLCLLLAASGKQLVLAIYGDDMKVARRQLDTFRSYHTSAVLVHSRVGVVQDEVYQMLAATEAECGPFILMAGREARPGVTYVAHDFARALIDLFDVVERNGPTQVLLVAARGRLGEAFVSDFRAEGSRRAGLDTDTALVEPTPAQGFGRAALSIIQEKARRGPLLVVTETDREAWSVVRAVQEAGLRVPEDVAVMGRGNTEIAAEATPPLTTLDVVGNIPKTAATVVEMIRGLDKGIPLDRKVHLVGPLRLVVRESYVPRIGVPVEGEVRS